MTAGSSIDPAEFLHEHLAQASPDLLRELIQVFINTLLSAEADSVCGAAYGARDAPRTNLITTSNPKEEPTDPTGAIRA